MSKSSETKRVRAARKSMDATRAALAALEAVLESRLKAVSAVYGAKLHPKHLDSVRVLLEAERAEVTTRLEMATEEYTKLRDLYGDAE